MSPAAASRRRMRPRTTPVWMMAAVALLFSAFAASAQTTEQPPPPPPMVSAVVPVVGSVDGVNGVRWRTEVILKNDFSTPVEVVMELPAAPDQPFWATTLAGGQALRFADVVEEAFSVQTALSPMIVSTAGRRSVTVVATAWGTRGDDPPVTQTVNVDYGGTYYPQRTLQGLSFSEKYRTNIGLANIADQGDAVFTLALQRIPGRNLAVTQIVLGPRQAWHSAIQTVFPLIPTGSGFTVVVETSSQKTCVYASVLDNETSQGHFVQPVIGTVNPLP